MFGGEEEKGLMLDGQYNVLQVNGQRIYKLRLRSAAQHAPPKGCELFVGKLPRDILEDKLVPIFTQIAPIYEMRLMVDFMGRNRGYCFVRYFTRDAADAAIDQLNNYEVREGCRIGVYKSLDNTRLFIGGLPVDKTRIEIWDALEKRIDNLKDIIMYPAYNDESSNRGYAFLEFEDHRAAAIARRRMPPGSLVLWGSHIKVDWADPLPEPHPNVMSKVSTLYLRNIPVSLPKESFKRIIYDTIMNPNFITRIHKTLDYAFIHCTDRVSAVKCKDQLQDFVVEGNHVEVTWARPGTYSKKYIRDTVPAHYCLSLPAKTRWQVRKKQIIESGSVRSASTDYDDDNNFQPLFVFDEKARENNNHWDADSDLPSCSNGHRSHYDYSD